MFIWVIITGVMAIFHLSLQIHVPLFSMLLCAQETHLNGSHLRLFCSLTSNFSHQCRESQEMIEMEDHEIRVIIPCLRHHQRLALSSNRGFSICWVFLSTKPSLFWGSGKMFVLLIFKPVGGNHPLHFLARGYWTISCIFYILCSHLL